MSYTDSATPDDVVPVLQSYLPSGAELDDESSYSEEGYYDLWYVFDGNYYIIYAEECYGEDCLFAFDIVPVEQADTYYDYCYDAE